jgi:hypothetical protein
MTAAALTSPDASPPRPRLPSRVKHEREAVERYPSLAPTFLSGLWRTDPLADDVARVLADDPSGARWGELQRACRDGLWRAETPAIRRLLDDAQQAPAWLDPDAAERGGRVLVRRGPVGGMLLGAALITGYAAPAGNKPLVLTGALTRSTQRRINETARFVEAVTAPGGSRPFAEGWAITLKVRVMHARVRLLCLDSGRWDDAAWGHPINQHDMLSTILLFSAFILEGFHTFGVPATPAEEADAMHLWSWVGHVIGVDPALLPLDVARGKAYADLLKLTQDPPDDDSRALTEAFVNAPLKTADTSTPRARETLERRVALSHGILRGLMGDELADGLGLAHNRYRHVVPVTAKALRRLAPLLRGPAADALSSRIGRRYWDKMMEIVLAEGTPTFAPPSALHGVRAQAGTDAR